jgi:hypothetical protein
VSIATVVTRGYGSFGSIAYVVREGYDQGAAPPPPPPPSPSGEAAGGGGWVGTVADLREHVERVERAQDATRKERRAAEHQLRQMLEAQFRGPEPEVVEAFTETLGRVVNFKASEIDWGPALGRIDLLERLIGKLQTIAILDEQERLDLMREEQDIEMILLSLP